MREKMRSLDTSIKADFIKKDKLESGSASSVGASSSSVPWNAAEANRPVAEERSQTDGGCSGAVTENINPVTSNKLRARSRTFTLSKGSDSPPKKQKSEAGTSHGRGKSIDLPQPGASKSFTSSASVQAAAFLAAMSKPAVPEDFIFYLRATPKPEKVEIGKIHKLRLLLRNETVAWVDSFITKGGMTEVVGLLYRIIDVEWRFGDPCPFRWY